MVNIAFCDDDKQFLSIVVPKVKSIFRHYGVDVHSYTFDNGDDLIISFSKYDPYYDIIFLDIDLPDKNGKEIARKLRILDKKFKLVFITAYPQEALNMFQYDIIGFIPKTIIFEKLDETIKLAIDKINEDDPKEQIFKVYKVDKSLKKSSGIIEVKVPLDDIIYFESINRQVLLHTRRETFQLHNGHFSEVVKKYLSFNFVDIHRTCIVNMKYIYSVDKFQIYLDNGLCLPLSRRKRQNIFNKLSKTVSEDHINR